MDRINACGIKLLITVFEKHALNNVNAKSFIIRVNKNGATVVVKGGISKFIDESIIFCIVLACTSNKIVARVNPCE